MNVSRWLSWLAPIVSLALAQPVAYRLDQALARLDRGVAVQKALQQVRKAESDLAIAQAKSGPQINLSTQGGYKLPLNASGELQAKFKLGLDVPLGVSNTASTTVKLAALGLRTAQAQLRQTRSAQARQVVRAYGQVLLADQQQTQAQIRLELTKDQVGAAEERQRLGAATLNDVLTANLAVSSAQQVLTQAEFALRDSKVNLARFLGLADIPGVQALASLPALDEAQALRDLLPTSPTLELARIQLEQAQLAQQTAALQGWPNLSLGLGYTSDRLAAALNLGFPNTALQASLGYQPLGGVQSATPNLNLTLGVSLPLWDSGVVAATQQGAAGGVDIAEAALAQANLDTRDLLESALRQVQLDQKEVQLQQAALQVAQQGLNEAQQRQQIGSLTVLEVLAAQVQLAVAQGSLLGAQLRVLEDTYQIYAVLGSGG